MMKDFSQSGEQSIILKYFGERKGTFLDCGANDGITLSNTRALAEVGWSGLLIEPSPMAFKKLCDNMDSLDPDSELHSFFDGPSGLYKKIDMINGTKALVAFNCAITTADGPIDLYDSGTHLKKGDVALLSTTIPREMDRWKKSGEVFTKTTVRGITFETLMRETGQNQFQFISIDAEGADYSILCQMDLTAVGCELLCIEFNQKDEKLFVDYCAKFGMRLHARTFENLIFAR